MKARKKNPCLHKYNRNDYSNQQSVFQFGTALKKFKNIFIFSFFTCFDIAMANLLNLSNIEIDKRRNIATNAIKIYSTVNNRDKSLVGA